LVIERTEPVPVRMLWVELRGALDKGAALLPVAGVRQQDAQEGCRGAVHWIEGNGALRGMAEGRHLFPEEQGLGQGVVSELAGRRRIHGPARSIDRSPQRGGPHIEVAMELGTLNKRE